MGLVSVSVMTSFAFHSRFDVQCSMFNENTNIEHSTSNIEC
jgi:hypothetical protein